MDLAILFYFVIIIAVISYSILDGFDLGVGMLHLFSKEDRDRRIFLNSIGPVWDGNEVWLVIIVGALFAGFPRVYATILTGFYLPTMVLLMGLMFRAVSIEFRSKRESKKWRKNWDIFFSLGSFIIAFGIGVFLANVMKGMPLNRDGDFIGGFFDLLHPFAFILGFTAIAIFMMHGSIFLVMKTEGDLHAQVRRWVPYTIGFFIVTYLITTFWAIFKIPHLIEPMLNYPWLFIFPTLSLVAILGVPYLMNKELDGWAFISSCLSITFLFILAAIGTFPYMVRSTISPETNSLTIANSASSPLTLKVLMIIVAIGVPLVLGYGFYIYRTFRGKVKLDSTSY